MTKSLSISAFIIVAIATACTLWQYTSNKPITLRFHAYNGDESLVFNDSRYANPGGSGQYLVRDLQLFVSNIRLLGEKNQYEEGESYHLLRFDNEQGYFDIVIEGLALKQYDTIEIGIGVDPEANGTIMFAGDLDPNGRMAWNWQVGYKFLLLEGSLDTNGSKTPLVYHIGFDESYTRVSFPLKVNELFSDDVIDFRVDINQLFDQKHPVDMSHISTVKFDPENVRTIARAFPQLISIQQN
ncbi:MbnP family protein [Thalassotalea sp. PS06]|uniref:MbnP family protein n=1 Tax=Thalassotalea sp. PS06 TaxID=2594005 RepID=UPI001163D0A0|nr:MbnP family protein [Thalassotalea sp. PS06]QDP01238.1 hypothetical protein FNC98_07755 [Thalassotalea sp. PS06]